LLDRITLVQIFALTIGSLWILAPILAWYISKENREQKASEKISDTDKQYIMEVANRTWMFFADFMTEESNYLAPDNYQESRAEKVTPRTSSTNIGLGLLAAQSAYDLGIIELDEAIDYIEKCICTVTKLQKWNGHLYNWYNTHTLEPLHPKFISSVDSGNFVGYLYVLKQFLLETQEKDVQNLIDMINQLIADTDFSHLYSPKKRLFSIGFDVEENKLLDSYYDLLASEARQASFVAIVKKDVPVKHWNNLSRTLTSLKKYKGLVSWSGTTFEYLMPNINMPKYTGSLLDESCRFMIMSGKEYASKLGTTWGISESAFNLKDLNNNYQYKAFGVPWLGFKRGLKDDMVVSPYSVFLSMEYDPNEAIRNLKQIEKQDMYGEYGFYESLDYTSSRLKYGEVCAAVKTYMAHHQGLILVAINNFVNNEINVKRFRRNPEIEAANILLQERMPAHAIVTKEKKEKAELPEIKDYKSYSEKIYTKVNKNLKKTNVISNGNYSIVTTWKGESYSKYNDIYINRFKETADVTQGIFFYIKNVKTKKIWANTKIANFVSPDKYTVMFSSHMTQFKRVDSSIETTTKIIIAPNDPVEIRRLELENVGNTDEVLEINSCFEPVLSTSKQDYAHPAFNNLFITSEELEEGRILTTRRKRGHDEKDQYLCTKLYTEAETMEGLEYEIDKEKFAGKGNLGIPEMVKDSKRYSKSTGLVTDPILAMKKTIKILPGEKITLDLIIAISENRDEAQETVIKYENSNAIRNTAELARVKSETENIYLGLKGTDVEKYQAMLTYILFQNPMKSAEMEDMTKEDLENGNIEIYSQEQLWKYGISRRQTYTTCKNRRCK